MSPTKIVRLTADDDPYKVGDEFTDAGRRYRVTFVRHLAVADSGVFYEELELEAVGVAS